MDPRQAVQAAHAVVQIRSQRRGETVAFGCILELALLEVHIGQQVSGVVVVHIESCCIAKFYTCLKEVSEGRVQLAQNDVQISLLRIEPDRVLEEIDEKEFFALGLERAVDLTERKVVSGIAQEHVHVPVDDLLALRGELERGFFLGREWGLE